MIAAAFRGVGKLCLLLATMALLTGLSLMIAGSFLMTFPILRMSPRNRRIQAGAELASAGMAFLAAFSERVNRE